MMVNIKEVNMKSKIILISISVFILVALIITGYEYYDYYVPKQFAIKVGKSNSIYMQRCAFLQHSR